MPRIFDLIAKSGLKKLLRQYSEAFHTAVFLSEENQKLLFSFPENARDQGLLTKPLFVRGSLVGHAAVPYTDPQSLDFIVDNLSTILENGYEIESLSAEVARNYEEFSFLWRLSSRLGAVLDVEKVCTIVVDEIMNICPSKVVSIMLVNNIAHDTVPCFQQPHSSPDASEGKETLLPKISRGVYADRASQMTLNTDAGLVGRAFDKKEALTVCDVSNDRRFEGFPYPVKRLLVVPLIVEDRAIGVILSSDKLNGEEFYSTEIKTISSIASECAISIKKASLFAERKQAEEQAKYQLDRIAALRDIDRAITSSFDLHFTLKVVLEEVTKQLRVDAADVLLFNSHLQTLQYAGGRGFRSDDLRHVQLPFGKGHAGQAAIERRIINIPNLSESSRDLTRAPLFAKEEFVSYYAAPLITKGQIKGVLEIFHRSRFEPNPDWLDFLDALATQAAIAIDNAELFNSLQRSNIDLIMAYDATIEGWAHALDYRDKETEGHSRRVTEMTVGTAQVMGMSDAELVHIRRGALLHDIGKMGIPDNILLKPGDLTDEEMKIMRKHPLYAYELLSPVDFLRPALDIPYCHHERWDGTGYPRGLKGDQIPLSARIFAVVDVWDALCSDRPYRPSWPKEKAREHIRQQTGKHFDPRVADLFLKTVSE